MLRKQLRLDRFQCLISTSKSIALLLRCFWQNSVVDSLSIARKKIPRYAITCLVLRLPIHSSCCIRSNHMNSSSKHFLLLAQHFELPPPPPFSSSLRHKMMPHRSRRENVLLLKSCLSLVACTRCSSKVNMTSVHPSRISAPTTAVPNAQNK